MRISHKAAGILLLTVIHLSLNARNLVFPVYLVDSTEPSAFDRIIQSSLSFEMQRKGFILLDPVLDEKDKSDLSSYLNQARSAEADFLVIAQYSSEQSQFDLDLSLYDVQGDAELNRVSKTGKIDLSMDRFIADCLDLLFDVELPQAPGGGEVVVLEPPSPTGESDDSPEVLGSEPDDQSEGIPLYTWDVRAGFTTQLPLGKLATYADPAYLGTLSLAYRFNFPGFSLNLGIYGGGGAFSATGAVSEAAVLTVPLGVEVVFLFPTPSVLTAGWWTRGGVVLWDLDRANASDVLLTLPFAASGFSLAFYPTEAFGVSLEAGALAVFDQDAVHFQFTPSFNLVLRL